MARFKVSLEKEHDLLARMERLGIREGDIDESFVRGSGAGGQKINKTSSCVYLIHRPTGTEVKCQRDRSQSLNRYLARRELCDKIEGVVLGKISAAERERNKVRKQKAKRSKRTKEKILVGKRQRSLVKQLRGKPQGD